MTDEAREIRAMQMSAGFGEPRKTPRLPNHCRWAFGCCTPHHRINRKEMPKNGVSSGACGIPSNLPARISLTPSVMPPFSPW